MSYEGYTQYLCEDGHYWTQDCMNDYDEKCFCGRSIAWSNMVNTTNGCEATSGDPNDLSNTHEKAGDCNCGYIPLEKIKETKCAMCNSILEALFKVPEKDVT